MPRQRPPGRGCSQPRNPSPIAADLGLGDDDDLHLGHIRHRSDRVRPPIAAGDAAFVELHLFVERVADGHHPATLNLPFELKWVDDDAGLDGDSVLVDRHVPGRRSHRHLAHTRPIRAAAQDHGYPLPPHRRGAGGDSVRGGDGRVCQPEASRTAWRTPIRRSSVVCLRRYSIGSTPAIVAASLIASSRGKFLVHLTGRAEAVVAEDRSQVAMPSVRAGRCHVRIPRGSAPGRTPNGRRRGSRSSLGPLGFLRRRAPSLSAGRQGEHQEAGHPASQACSDRAARRQCCLVHRGRAARRSNRAANSSTT